MVDDPDDPDEPPEDVVVPLDLTGVTGAVGTKPMGAMDMINSCDGVVCRSCRAVT